MAQIELSVEGLHHVGVEGLHHVVFLTDRIKSYKSTNYSCFATFQKTPKAV
jgi:hypothetical protein